MIIKGTNAFTDIFTHEELGLKYGEALRVVERLKAEVALLRNMLRVLDAGDDPKIERELWACDNTNSEREERAAHELYRQRRKIERLRAALHLISEHDPSPDYRRIARAALEGK